MIYFLDEDPLKAGDFLSDKHLSCQLGSTCTILYTVLINTGSILPLNTQRQITRSNPIVDWACKSTDNYLWLWEYGKSVKNKFYRVFNKIHKTSIDLDNVVYPQINKIGITEFPKCIPNIYITESAPVHDYRRFYVSEKANLLKYRLGTPDWILEGQLNTELIIYKNYFKEINTDMRVVRRINNIYLQKYVGRDWVDLSELCSDSQLLLGEVFKR